MHKVHTTIIIVTLIFHQKKGYCSRHKCILCPLIIIIKLPLSLEQQRDVLRLVLRISYCIVYTGQKKYVKNKKKYTCNKIPKI